LSRIRVKKKDYENLSASNIKKVISLLNPPTLSPVPTGQPTVSIKAITKKEACDILNIAYNTTRLDKIIAEYYEQLEYVASRKRKNRGQAATNQEVSEAVAGYLRGEPIADIAKNLYRSPAFVKALIEKVGVPERVVGEDSAEVDYLPEQCIAESFNIGDIVWSAKYHSSAIIEDEISVDYQAERPGYLDVNYERKYNSKCYAIYVLARSEDDSVYEKRKPGFSAFSLAYDLGSLEHLKEYGVDLHTL